MPAALVPGILTMQATVPSGWVMVCIWTSLLSALAQVLRSPKLEMRPDRFMAGDKSTWKRFASLSVTTTSRPAEISDGKLMCPTAQHSRGPVDAIDVGTVAPIPKVANMHPIHSL